MANDSRGIEIGNVENIPFNGPAGMADEPLRDSSNRVVNQRTELILRETVQLYRLRDFVRLTAYDDRY